MTYDNWKLQSPETDNETILIECENGCGGMVEELTKVGFLEVCEHCIEELTEAQNELTKMFDPLWKYKLETNKNLSKIPAIMSVRRWLAKEMNISDIGTCRIEKFNLNRCQEAYKIIDNLYGRNEALRVYYETGQIQRAPRGQNDVNQTRRANQRSMAI